MTETHQLTNLFSAEDGLNFQIGRPSSKKHMSQFFLQANYRVLPNFSEIRECEAKYENWEQKGDNLDFRPYSHHEIFDSQAVIDKANLEINNIAYKVIPDFHFLEYKVSTFWPCEKSPIGMCVWVLDEGRFHLGCYCRYCGGPVERK